MADMIDIKVVIDARCIEPRVEIHTKSETEMVGNIINAIETVARNKYPPVMVQDKGVVRIISQRDIYRVRTEGREVRLDTEDSSYPVRGTMAKFESELDEERFFRISQSEIINLYKVDSFDFSIVGTVGVQFDNGIRSYVARRCVKPLRDKLKKMYEYPVEGGEQR